MSSTTIEGLRISYDRYLPSQAEPGQRAIYIHGTGCNGRVFEDHLRAISNRHEVVAIDLPGHGRSEGSGFRGAADYAFFVAALIDRLGWQSCIVAGHSLGGGIALAVAVYFEALVAGLMLIDTGARLRVNPRLLDFARKAAEAGSVPDADARFGYAEKTPRSVVDGISAITAGCDPRVTYKDWIADDSFDFMSRLAQINVPALAICGEEDPLTPLKYHEYFRDKLPDCRLVTIADAGHWPFVENRAAFDAGVMEFLGTL